MRLRTAATVAAALICLVPAGGPAHAGADFAYRIHVTFGEYLPYSIDDCMAESACDYAEVYGSLSAQRVAPGGATSGQVRNIGRFVNPGDTWCGSPGIEWSAGVGGDCLKRVNGKAPSYAFADVLMCRSSTYKTCESARNKHMNTVELAVVPGDAVYVGVHIRDYDELSPDDDICKVALTTPALTDAELSDLDESGELHDMDSGDGGCLIRYSIKKTGIFL
ncbi:hypothetical protein ABGB17_31080 [Sphaerisporangium sp. B11E5]|uniref:hypothetical protein n=1 Tax=Sphaerisporangium sp. B11E5 TaxID=3153563 RepID=UPI00325D8F57